MNNEDWYLQPSAKGGFYSVPGKAVGRMMDWIVDNLGHCIYEEEEIEFGIRDVDIVATLSQIPKLKEEVERMNAKIEGIYAMEDLENGR